MTNEILGYRPLPTAPINRPVLLLVTIPFLVTVIIPLRTRATNLRSLSSLCLRIWTAKLHVPAECEIVADGGNRRRRVCCHPERQFDIMRQHGRRDDDTMSTFFVNAADAECRAAVDVPAGNDSHGSNIHLFELFEPVHVKFQHHSNGLQCARTECGTRQFGYRQALLFQKSGQSVRGQCRVINE